MTQYLSDKIKVMSAFCIILVLYIHSGFHDLPHEILGMPMNHYLQQAISGMLGRCAVPIFFTISGYLFWRTILSQPTQAGQWAVLIQKMKSRVKTLLIPYVIAAFSLPLFYLLMDHVPAAAPFINASGLADSLWDNSIGELLISLFYDGGNGAPMTFQLWFLRDLIVLVALSPIFWALQRKIGFQWMLPVLFVCTCIYHGLIPFWGAFWFLLGGFCSTTSWRVPASWAYASIPIYMLLSAAEMIFPSDLWAYFKTPITGIGCLALWTLCDMLLARSLTPLKGDIHFSLQKHHLLTVACGYTFFVYLYHEPALNIVRKLVALPWGHSSAGFAFSYLVSPWIFALIMVGIGSMFKKWLPRVYGVLVGGR
jgi:peptidoglycan/LPS O-acetylase OafA/YrhL